jgi:hypothetical protein
MSSLWMIQGFLNCLNKLSLNILVTCLILSDLDKLSLSFLPGGIHFEHAGVSALLPEQEWKLLGNASPDAEQGLNNSCLLFSQWKLWFGRRAMALPELRQCDGRRPWKERVILVICSASLVCLHFARRSIPKFHIPVSKTIWERTNFLTIYTVHWNPF